MISVFEKLQCDGCFNPRIVFKFIYKAMGERNRLDGTYHLYKVFSGEKEPETEEEFGFSRALSAYRFLVSEGISAESLSQAASFYFPEVRKPDFAGVSVSPSRSPIGFYYALAGCLPNAEGSAFFALVCLNAFLAKRGMVPLVANSGACEYMFQMALCGVTEGEFDYALSHLVDLSLMYNVRYPEASLDEVKERVRAFEAPLRSEFGVASISLIGSITKDYFDAYSDVDFLVLFESGSETGKPALKAFLSDIVKRRADVMERNSPCVLSAGVLEYAVKIF